MRRQSSLIAGPEDAEPDGDGITGHRGSEAVDVVEPEARTECRGAPVQNHTSLCPTPYSVQSQFRLTMRSFSPWSGPGLAHHPLPFFGHRYIQTYILHHLSAGARFLRKGYFDEFHRECPAFAPGDAGHLRSRPSCRTHRLRRAERGQSMSPLRGLFAILLAASTASCMATGETAPDAAGGARVRVAVVGGLVLSGVWPALAARASKATGLEIDTVAAAPKEGVVPAFRNGDADLLLIHGSDETYGLLAAGVAAPLRAWAMNEHVIVGPKDDPAGVAGAPGAAEAMRRIIAADAPDRLP